MTTSPIALLRLLVAALIAGATLGVLYDAIRISRVMTGMSRYTAAASAPILCPQFYKPRTARRRGRPTDILRQVLLVAEDFLFCLTVGIVMALLLFSHNNGEFRGFVPLGMAAGFAAYYFTVGKLVIRVSEYVVFAIKAAVLYAVYYLTRPFILLGRLIFTCVRRVIEKQRQKNSEKKIRRYTEAGQKALMAMAQNGFLAPSSAEK